MVDIVDRRIPSLERAPPPKFSAFNDVVIDVNDRRREVEFVRARELALMP